MNPEIELMLEKALASIQPSLNGVGRVSVSPDYESGLTEEEAPAIRQELTALLRETKVDR